MSARHESELFHRLGKLEALAATTQDNNGQLDQRQNQISGGGSHSKCQFEESPPRTPSFRRTGPLDRQQVMFARHALELASYLWHYISWAPRVVGVAEGLRS
jgi:hypothetical protein